MAGAARAALRAVPTGQMRRNAERLATAAAKQFNREGNQYVASKEIKSGNGATSRVRGQSVCVSDAEHFGGQTSVLVTSCDTVLLDGYLYQENPKQVELKVTDEGLLTILKVSTINFSIADNAVLKAAGAKELGPVDDLDLALQLALKVSPEVRGLLGSVKGVLFPIVANSFDGPNKPTQTTSLASKFQPRDHHFYDSRAVIQSAFGLLGDNAIVHTNAGPYNPDQPRFALAYKPGKG